MTVYIYLRVSTDKQDLETQMESVKRWLSEKGITEYKIIKDEGISGSVPAKQRPGFSNLLGIIEEGDVLVVSELTRIGRSLSDVIFTLDELTKRGIRVVAVKEGLDSTANEMQFKVMSTLLALFADLEREFIRKRTKEGLQKAREAGKRIGRPRALSEEQLITVAELYRKGFKIKEIASILNVSSKTVSRALKKLKEQGIIEEKREIRVNKKKFKEIMSD